MQSEALATAEAWLDRWATHVGTCRGGDMCTCGLTAVLHEVRAALRPSPEAKPVGFKAAEADWNEAVAGRPMSLEDWSKLTLGEQAKYRAAESPSPEAVGEWRPIESAPTDGTHFLAYCIDAVDEYDEDERLVARAVPTPTIVIAYQVEWLGGIVEYPWRGSILQNRRYAAWTPLPPAPEKEEGK